MFKFFLPASKVQKDRRIMRETDSRLAKYSRRGVVFNFFAFLLCTAHGRFIDENPGLMAVLTAGILLNTVIRSFYLFRFDNLYPRAPAKWRSQYFFATLVGAVWWGVIMVFVTLELDMDAEAPLLWLYTVIFFSSTAHAFAPYQKFLSYYQFFGLIPASAAAFYVGGLNGYIYGSVMLVFYLMLTHQCRLMSENYWERLEATYALARKTLSIEEEKRDTKANVKLNQEFMKHLYNDIDRFMNHVHEVEGKDSQDLKLQILSEIDELHTNISDFSGVLSKELDLDEQVFNIRHEIQHLVAEFIDTAETHQIQIETSLSPTLPMRLKGDASRLAQIIRALLNIILDDVAQCIVLVEVEFLREYENAGELYVSVTRSFDKSKKLFSNDTVMHELSGTLGLVVAKGLAELMDGSIELNEALQEEQQLRFNAKIDIAEHAGQLDFHKDSFSGKNVLLVHNHPRIVDIKRQELDALGFNVFTETQYSRAIQTLENSYKFQTPIESLIFYSDADIDTVITFCESLKQIQALRYTKKIAAATRKQQQELRLKGFDESHGFYFVDKPTGLFEIESLFHELYHLDEPSDDAEAYKAVLFTNGQAAGAHSSDQFDDICKGISLVESNTPLSEALASENDVQIALIDCDTNDDVAELVHNIRAYEAGREVYMPILGLSRGKEAFEDFAYELGLDDYIDLTHNPKKTLKSTISYWSTLI
ncbi:MAG: sensor histidine kinase [Agarilytica sp.]